MISHTFFLENSFYSVPILCIAMSSLSWNDQITDSPGRVPSFESEAVDLIHWKVWLQIWFCGSSISNLKWSSALESLDGAVFLLGRHDQNAIPGNRGSLDAQKRSCLFLNIPARHLSLDLISLVWAHPHGSPRTGRNVWWRCLGTFSVRVIHFYWVALVSLSLSLLCWQWWRQHSQIWSFIHLRYSRGSDDGFAWVVSRTNACYFRE